MIKKIEHVAIRVEDIETSIKFYTETLGFKLRKRFCEKESSVNIAFITVGDLELEILEFPKWAGNVDDSVQNFPHLSFTVEDADATMKELMQRGVKFESEEILKVQNESLAIAFFRGPSGELLEISQRLK